MPTAHSRRKLLMSVLPGPVAPGAGLVELGVSSMAAKKTDTIELRNVNHPGQVRSVDGAMYDAMKNAFLKILPRKSPGLTEAEARAAVLAHLPEDLFPGGAKAGWWTKAVQLDLEAKGLVSREKTKPLRWRKA